MGPHDLQKYKILHTLHPTKQSYTHPNQENMQLTKFATFTALAMTVSAEVLGNLHGDHNDDLEFFARSSCSNQGKIGRPNRYAAEGCAISLFFLLSVHGFLICDRSTKLSCVPEKSRGFLSSHNCWNKGGAAYLCVQGGQSFCVSGKANVKKANYENGECFV